MSLSSDDAAIDNNPNGGVEAPHIPQASKGSRGGALREVVVIIVVALVLSAIVRTFLFQAFWIPSGSMENTLLPEDRVLVNKVTTRFGEVERGQVVVFRDPSNWLSAQPETGNPVQRTVRKGLEFIGLAPSRSDRDLVKRVIGVGGDRVKCCDPDGRVTVNGYPLDEESYLYPGDAPSETPFDVIVPAGTLWVMGDHRSASGDSRVHTGDPGGGFVPVSDVVGRGAFVLWPVSRWEGLPIPATFTDVPAAKAPTQASRPTPTASP